MQQPAPAQRRVLIVDDERDIRELLSLTITRLGLLADSASDLAAAKSQLSAHSYDFCLTDMRLPDGTGLNLIAHMATRYPDVPVAMLTAYGNIETAVSALKAGAFDFIAKPVDLTVLRRLIAVALALGQQREVLVSPSALVGNSAIMHELRQTIAKLARSQAPVHIVGETGSGKERVARLIHEQGPRRAAPFVPVNCGAIPVELMESEFFGYKKGSFTSAGSDKDGLFQAASGGTLFLDEVAELPLHMQVKLLRAIQEKSVRPIGSASEVSVDVRILSATHKNLSALVESHLFRSDLFYRLNVIEVVAPPLRARPTDIPLLVSAIMEKLSVRTGERQPALTQAALTALCRYQFPGNVRELENILERASALRDGPEIRVEDLRLGEGTLRQGNTTMATAGSHAIIPLSVPLPLRPDANSPAALPEHMEKLERDVIVGALRECRQDKALAAEALGITLRTLKAKLKKFEID